MKYNNGEITEIVFLTMIFSIFSILLIIFSEISRICQICRPQSKKFINKINIQTSITISSPNLRYQHAYCNKKIEACLQDTLNQSNEMSKIIKRSDVTFDIECFYISSTIYTFKSFKAYIDINILCNETNIKDIINYNINKMGDITHTNHIALKTVKYFIFI